MTQKAAKKGSILVGYWDNDNDVIQLASLRTCPGKKSDVVMVADDGIATVYIAGSDKGHDYAGLETALVQHG